MQEDTLKKLVNDIIVRKSESQTIELKLAEKGCPNSLYDTLSSFSNQDDGGIIIFGIDETDYTIKGVYDPQDLQKKVIEQCNQMQPQVRALFTICEINKKIIVSAEIPSVDLNLRPVFYKGKGRLKGSYIRVGDADEIMTEYEIYSYEAYKQRIEEDIRIVEKSTLSFFNQELLNQYLKEVKKERERLASNFSDKEILEFMGITVNEVPTLAGVMIFSKYPQTFFPNLCITAIAVPGLEIGQTGINEERFLDNKRITGTISEMLEDALNFVSKNCRTITIIDDNGKRTDKKEYPLKAVREAILNALIHRDYSVYTENTPISIVIYRDRLEIINPGSIYGKLSVKDLGKLRPDTRNPRITNILELLKITENRYSGIPTMKIECQKYGLPEPIFAINHGEFKVIFKTAVNYNQNSNSKESILDFCKVPRTRSELTKFTGKSQYYTMSKIIQPLILEGKIKLEIPEKPRSSKQRYLTNIDFS